MWSASETMFDVGDRHHICMSILQRALEFFVRQKVRVSPRRHRVLLAFALYRELLQQGAPRRLGEVAEMFQVRSKLMHRMGLLVEPNLCHKCIPSMYMSEAGMILGLSPSEQVSVGGEADRRFERAPYGHPKSLLGVAVYDYQRRHDRPCSLRRVAGALGVSVSSLKRNRYTEGAV